MTANAFAVEGLSGLIRVFRAVRRKCAQIEGVPRPSGWYRAIAVRTILELRPMPDGGLSASYLVPRLANPAYDQTGLKY
jgi:hypothetical protein